MANGTLKYSSTTVTLPRPNKPISREYIEIVREAATVGGYVRRTIFSKKYLYHITFPYATLSLYDSIISLWQTAQAAGSFLTFAFTTAFSSANNVLVSAQIGPAEYTNTPGYVTFELILTEANPR